MKKEDIINIQPLAFMWPILNPFLFFAHHEDHYPPGNEAMGPAASLAGRNIGSDFTLKDGWRMYHGEKIPGFPVHPHRGFETITIVKNGFVDHADSHGQAGRYGAGDVQWMTAGAGLQHSEMFPLLNMDRDNPAELFQIWLNLPRAKKFADPHFKMLWSEDIPQYREVADDGRSLVVKVIAGRYEQIQALDPAPDSWAADPLNEVGIWSAVADAGTQWIIPAAKGQVNRMLYFHEGSTIDLQGTNIEAGHAITLDASREIRLVNGNAVARMLLLQGKPILEPVVQYGPFVMNAQAEISQAIEDFRRTSFGGWPWPSGSQVYPRDRGRFALHKDGREEIKKPNKY